ncbi:MAG: hypothetical protein DRJ66_05260 [Thermoprotei archaeon]|nr:MAG: hypothetical protein DRJ66_05260 [Thermoprotei archaeon]RLF19650.1 MAG: hypothetical protein DRZ82_04905 [Thermoprotei archaeon]
MREVDVRKVLDSLEERGVAFADIILVDEEYYCWALRGFSADMTRERSKIACVRVLNNGVWGVACEYGDVVDYNRLVRRALLSCNVARANKDMAVLGYAEGPSLSINYVHPVKVLPVDMSEEVFSILSEIKSLFEVQGVRIVEVLLDFWLISKRYWNTDGSVVFERKPLLTLTIYVVTDSGQVSGIVGSSSGLEFLREKGHLWLIENMRRRIVGLAKSRALNPLFSGFKFEVILDYDVSAAFVHEAIGHMLQADNYMTRRARRLPIGLRISSDELTIYDDPTVPNGFGSYICDDEGIRADRKTLIEDGIIVSFVNSRSSAAFFNMEPTGNGRGWNNVARSMMSNLVVKPGDWRPNEMIEETKRGIVLQGLIMGRYDENGNVIIEAENGIYVERGEVKSFIRGPLVLKGNARRLLSSICAIGRYIASRPSFEKGMPISEYVPMLKLSQARIYSQA